MPHGTVILLVLLSCYAYYNLATHADAILCMLFVAKLRMSLSRFTSCCHVAHVALMLRMLLSRCACYVTLCMLQSHCAYYCHGTYVTVMLHILLSYATHAAVTSVCMCYTVKLGDIVRNYGEPGCCDGQALWMEA